MLDEDQFPIDIDVFIDLPHTFSSDLDLSLENANGQIAVLTTDNGAGLDNVFAGTLFDSHATKLVTDVTYANGVVATPLIPEGTFNQLDGGTANGEWTLHLTDDQAGNTGTLQEWSLTIHYCDGLDYGGINEDGPSSDTVAIIPDDDQVVQTVNHSGQDGEICQVNVMLNISHPSNREIVADVTSPAGTIATITSHNGGFNANVFSGTFFTEDGASETVTDFSFQNNVTPSFLVPEGSFRIFDGENPNGDWTITVFDTLAGNTGTLNSWFVDIGTCGTDPDQDGIGDPKDNCSAVKNSEQEDGDGDGAGDVCDECLTDSSKSEAGQCGCGNPDTDSDSDSTADCVDLCPKDSGKTAAGECGCGTADIDEDGNGLLDCFSDPTVTPPAPSAPTTAAEGASLGTKVRKLTTLMKGKTSKDILTAIRTSLANISEAFTESLNGDSFTDQQKKLIRILLKKMKRLQKGKTQGAKWKRKKKATVKAAKKLNRLLE
jgi:subtilisin-like proprotein convertase family protein